MRRILVIRYGGFGDLILSMGAFRTIRAHHQGDHIAVLTTRPFAELLAACRYFDEILMAKDLGSASNHDALPAVSDVAPVRSNRETIPLPKSLNDQAAANDLTA